MGKRLRTTFCGRYGLVVAALRGQAVIMGKYTEAGTLCGRYGLVVAGLGGQTCTCTMDMVAQYIS